MYEDREMNRALRNQRSKGCMFRKHGGGYGMGAPLAEISADEFAFSPKVPVYQVFDDCAFPARPGQIVSQPEVSLAQVAMAGGKRSRRYRGGCGSGCPKVGGKRTRKMRAMHSMRGGVFAVDTAQSVGGTGPNVLPVYAAVPCDVRAVAGFNPELRAPATLYSLTANQSGGAEGVSGAYASAPGSLIPVYNAPVAGFTFAPSNAAGLAMPAGVAVFNEVVPQVARVGGAHSKRKSRKQRKHRKVSRKH